MTKRTLVCGRIHWLSPTSVTLTILQGSILCYLVRVISVFLGSGANIRIHILGADSEADAF